MKTERDEDYLVCREYQEQIHKKSTEYPGFITFQHTNGNFYFAWEDSDKIIIRSEAYPDADKMERGIKALIKNRDLAERYSVEVGHGAHFLVLWGGGDHQAHTGNMESHNEIGRSCPQRSRREVHDLLLSKGLAFADKVVPRTSADKVSTSTIVEKVAPAVAHATAESIAASSGDQSKMKAPTTAATRSGASHIRSEVPAAIPSKTGGFNWMWLLPLLLIPLFFLWRSCNKKSLSIGANTTSVTTPATKADVAILLPQQQPMQ